jgi:hypothetical protein
MSGWRRPGCVVREAHAQPIAPSPGGVGHLCSSAMAAADFGDATPGRMSSGTAYFAESSSRWTIPARMTVHFWPQIPPEVRRSEARSGSSMFRPANWLPVSGGKRRRRTLQLPIFPAGTKEINRDLGVRCAEGKVVYLDGHFAGVPARGTGPEESPADYQVDGGQRRGAGRRSGGGVWDGETIRGCVPGGRTGGLLPEPAAAAAGDETDRGDQGESAGVVERRRQRGGSGVADGGVGDDIAQRGLAANRWECRRGDLLV